MRIKCRLGKYHYMGILQSFVDVCINSCNICAGWACVCVCAFPCPKLGYVVECSGITLWHMFLARRRMRSHSLLDCGRPRRVLHFNSWIVLVGWIWRADQSELSCSFHRYRFKICLLVRPTCRRRRYHVTETSLLLLLEDRGNDLRCTWAVLIISTIIVC
jgi:hypothetical protein